MLQHLRYGGTVAERAEFPIITGSGAYKFLFVRFGYLVILIYSIFFLAVAIPFEGTYFIGSFIATLFLVRFVNLCVMFARYRNGRIAVDNGAIAVTDASATVTLPSSDITYLEVNPMGNLVIRQKYDKTAFPLVLLTDEDQSKLLDLFEDMAPKKTALTRKVIDFFDAILVAFILAMHIRQYIVQAYFIPTGSMEDTLQIGDHLLVEKITFGPIIPRMAGMKDKVHLRMLGLRDIKRGDIIIFKPPHEENKDFIKRCVALPGDVLNIKNGAVFVNGKKAVEPYVRGATSYRGFSDQKIEGVVPPGKLVVLGDNRENSYDGRGFGYLPISEVKGKAFILYFNWDQIKNFDFSRLGLIR
ncbi:MAG TPA: signal peptidase I [Spirochaetota bacterium]|nr:signal peptidase I [Spirochaetota bacterium]HNT11425.1 signal peptidase I [Spirochaetota bacterium]